MSLRLKQPIEKILSSTEVPNPPLIFQRSNLKRVLLNDWKNATPLPAQSLGRQFGKVLGFVSFGLLVLIGGSTVLAQANRSMPGQPLYRLNRALERTQLVLTQGEAAKLELKLDFAAERLEEASSLDAVDSPLAAEVVPDARIAIREIDSQFDEARVALALDQPAELSRDELSQLTGEFKQLLARYEMKLIEMNEAVNNPLVKEALADIGDILAVELSDTRDLPAGGSYVELEGELSDDGTGFTFNGQRLELVGLPNRNPLAGGHVGWVKVMGELVGDELKADQITQEPYRLSANDQQFTFSADGVVLQQDADGLFVDNGSKRFYLSGSLISDKRLLELVDQPVEIEGFWQGGPDILLTKVAAETLSGRVELPDAVNPEADQSEAGEALPAEDSNPIDSTQSTSEAE